MILLNPKTESFDHLDEKSREIMLKTIDFFETKGKIKLIDDYNAKEWYADFLDFIKENEIFYTMILMKSSVFMVSVTGIPGR